MPDPTIDSRHFTLNVEYRGDDLWAVTDGFGCLNRSGEWSHEPIPSEREDEWKAEHRFDLATALRLAEQAAPNVTCNGWTVTDVLTKAAERSGRR